MRIVDPNTNRDILTGEEVPPSAVVTPTSAAPPDTPATGAVCVPAVVTDEVEAPVAVSTSSTKVTEEIAASAKVEVVVPPKAAIVEEKVEEKMAPAVVAATPATQPAPTVPATVAAPVAATSEPAAQVGKKEAAIAAPVTQENGEVPPTSEPPSSSTSPTPVSTSASPDQGDGKKLFSNSPSPLFFSSFFGCFRVGLWNFGVRAGTNVVPQ